MGRGKRPIPKHLPAKLKEIRHSLNLSMDKMVEYLESELLKVGYIDIKIYSGHIAEFEQGKREPSLPVLFGYSLISKLSINTLIDDREKSCKF